MRFSCVAGSRRGEADCWAGRSGNYERGSLLRAVKGTGRDRVERLLGWCMDGLVLGRKWAGRGGRGDAAESESIRKLYERGCVLFYKKRGKVGRFFG